MNHIPLIIRLLARLLSKHDPETTPAATSSNLTVQQENEETCSPAAAVPKAAVVTVAASAGSSPTKRKNAVFGRFLDRGDGGVDDDGVAEAEDYDLDLQQRSPAAAMAALRPTSTKSKKKLWFVRGFGGGKFVVTPASQDLMTTHRR